MNKDLRIKILNIVRAAKEGHIPSSFSIVDIDYLYGNILKILKKNPNSINRTFLFE